MSPKVSKTRVKMETESDINMTEQTKSRYVVTVTGAFYREGSSNPWRGGTYTAEVVAESRPLAILEVMSGLSEHGKIRAEGGDCDWTVFDEEQEMTISVAALDSDYQRPVIDESRAR